MAICYDRLFHLMIDKKIGKHRCTRGTNEIK